MRIHFSHIIILVAVVLFSPIDFVCAQQTQINLKVSDLTVTPKIFISPSSAGILQGATFDMSVFLDTKKLSINAIDLGIKFDPNKLIIVSPSAGKSIIGVWTAPPAYSNTNGTVSLAGVIPNGIITTGGLITTITFKAMAIGSTTVFVSQTSKLLLNDGLGSELSAEFGQGQYSILPVPPAGPQVFSDTHPFSQQYYNNNSPAFGWAKDPDVTGFSYVLDNKPFTIPDNKQVVKGTDVAFQDISDGFWYFHIKAQKNGIWGTTTHFLVRIDTAPPAVFQPRVEKLADGNKALVSFFTTDNLSGIDHYEVGTLSQDASDKASLFFMETESPYQVSATNGAQKVIVRAFDKAGNVTDENVDISVLLAGPKDSVILGFVKQNILPLGVLLILVNIVIVYILLALYRRRVIKRMTQITKLISMGNQKRLAVGVKPVLPAPMLRLEPPVKYKVEDKSQK